MCTERIGVYVHVPYCRVVCPYCDFVKRALKGEPPTRFVEALCDELKAFDGPRAISSVFFGGGTPSLITGTQLDDIFSALRSAFTYSDPEITMEANPEDVHEESLRQWRDLGVTRVSLGVQSFDDEVLNYLGRGHDAETARAACRLVGHAFANWGMDLIYGGGPSEAWTATLSESLEFAPPHISAYSLTFEEKTAFWPRRDEAVDDDESLALYRRAHAHLRDYDHYEISNYAREGFQSKHNLIYWSNGEYIGFGPGAYSFVNGVRSRNQSNIAAYIRDPLRKEEALELSAREVRVETLIQYFRTRRGLPRPEYIHRFGCKPSDDFDSELSGLVSRGLLVDEGDWIRPTERGFELNDEIGLALVSPMGA